jgi:uncharacterized protein (TIGR00255 family)
MTGFGRSEGVFEGKKYMPEIKSLNSKSFDLNLKIPLHLKEKEFEIRKILSDKIIRGKIDFSIGCELLEANPNVKINRELIRNYMNLLKECALDGPDFEYLKMAVRLPDAISGKTDELDENEWIFLQNLIEKAIEEFDNFRKTEGSILKEDMLKSIENIGNYLSEIVPFEKVRMEILKSRYEKTLSEFENVDETRFYQELAYYAEKLDISEEKVRLAQHLKYFNEVAEDENLNGKKLGFISQEIGREINTLGSKAAHADIQKLVVKMKDDLEKIKEQTMNVL